VAQRTLTLKRPDPATKPKVDPAKVALADALGLRFIDRGGRYIAQKLVVTYEERLPTDLTMNLILQERSRTWIDVPLVPETYFVP
jgi:hypothetical protein